VKCSAVLALGLIGDADEDEVDRWIRWALNRSARSGDPLERRFAMIALARVGARKGQLTDGFAATSSVRKDLLHHLARARKDLKPWAGLALGVLGWHLYDEGGPVDPNVDRALQRAMRKARGVQDLGAYAVAVGLRGNRDAGEYLLDRMDGIKDEAARSYAALAVGMSGVRGAIEPLQAVLSQAEEDPLMATRAGIALGLLGDSSIVGSLITILEESESEAQRIAAARTLGYLGDRRAVETLCGLITDGEATEAVREAAMAALGFVSDSAATTWRQRLAGGVNYLARTPTLTDARNPGVLDFQ